MIDELRTLAAQYGDRLEFVPLDLVMSMQQDLEQFKSETVLNERQMWALSFSDFKGIPPKSLSIIIIAVPNPLTVTFAFTRNGKDYTLQRPAAKSLGNTRTYIMKAIKEAGFTVKVATRLPLKRLAVQSGLAEYGRNNISYAKGIGSYMSLTALATDIPCEPNVWRAPVVSPACEGCDLCLHNCPSGAINHDGFLLNSQKCTRCSKCQDCCPMNESRAAMDICFDEAETEIICSGPPYGDITKELAIKIDLLGIDRRSRFPHM